MFETSVVQGRVKVAARRPLLFSLSIGAHAAAVIGVVAMSVASVSLPKNAPHQMTFPVIPEMRPHLGDGSVQQKKPAAAQQQVVKRQTVAPAVVAPTTVPQTVTPVAPQTTADTGPIGPATGPATSGDATGPGVPWGTTDGIGDGPPVTTTATAPKIYTVSGDVKPPVVLRRVTPLYPEVARRMRLNGFVILQCIIDQSGNIRDAQVVRSSFAAFEKPALDAVYQWQFAPGRLSGVPVDVQFDLKVTFEIH